MRSKRSCWIGKGQMDILCWPTFTRPRAQWRTLKRIFSNWRESTQGGELPRPREDIRERGLLGRGKKLCEKAREVDPDSPLVANNLAYLYLEHGGDVNVALSLAQMVRQKMPNSPDAADTLGWAYTTTPPPKQNPRIPRLPQAPPLSRRTRRAPPTSSDRPNCI